MAVVSKARPDGNSTADFREHLAVLRSDWLSRGAPPCGTLPMCLWVPGRRGNYEGAKQTAKAECGAVHLLVVEMGERVLARTPNFVPRISWCLRGLEDEHPITGGPAPSFENAKLRAELALRVYLGAGLDS